MLVLPGIAAAVWAAGYQTPTSAATGPEPPPEAGPAPADTLKPTATAVTLRRDLPETYCLLPGETLSQVAEKAGVTTQALIDANPGFSGYAGVALKLPTGSTPPFAWESAITPRPAEALPFGVSGYFMGRDNRAKRVSLTFDIGYVAQNRDLMRLLAERGIRATFFVVGESVAAHPEVVRDIVQYGHEPANHSWSHGFLSNLSPEEVLQELRKTETAVKDIAPSATTKPMFRAPFGRLSPQLVETAKLAGYYTVGWTVDSGDWVAGVTADAIVAKVTQGVCPGAIVVMHDADLPSFAALPRILDFLKQHEYQVVPLSVLLFR